MRRIRARIPKRSDVWLVVHPDLQRNARVRAVAEYLTEILRDGSATLLGNR